ncbi:hypothetical protein CHS0354_019201, partial [Potamilus streckersoni]
MTHVGRIFFIFPNKRLQRFVTIAAQSEVLYDYHTIRGSLRLPHNQRFSTITTQSEVLYDYHTIRGSLRLPHIQRFSTITAHSEAVNDCLIFGGLELPVSESKVDLKRTPTIQPLVIYCKEDLQRTLTVSPLVAGIKGDLQWNTESPIAKQLNCCNNAAWPKK